MEEVLTKSEVLKAVEADSKVCYLIVRYEEAQGADALGQVFSITDTQSKSEVPAFELNTNDTLRTLWASPSGALWVGSADGNVGTTARVNWPAAPDGVDYSAEGASPPWSVAALPRTREGLRPNVTTLWGLGDAEVYAGTYEGHIYRWDGAAWAQVHEGPGASGSISSFGGNSTTGVFALGMQGTLLHFDGTAFRQLPLPGTPVANEGFTGIVVLADGNVLISGSSQQGRLLHGTADGLTEFGRYPLQLIGMAGLGDRILFATGNGVAELIGRDIQMIKSNFSTATISAGKDRLFFTEPGQDSGPRFIQYVPSIGENGQWMGIRVA